MHDDSIPDRLSKPGRDAPSVAPTAEPFEDPTNQPARPSNASGDLEIDIVDFQSMQSFPASDPPSWPPAYSANDEQPAHEQDNNECPPA